uniref:Uncharacterized protein n=1 Tax=Picea glauca TaxID=3330 RepID=A0A101LZE1_PICGL|nr:hypothetical protein ABT39_MTgene5143 [Picea glauca]KUM49918.1 hypothetical protein ABT39_MTgene3145 [Picea glauca]QHR86436.1 hypothetical protein Q903MT_gene435 [Picea sitchensis]
MSVPGKVRSAVCSPYNLAGSGSPAFERSKRESPPFGRRNCILDTTNRPVHHLGLAYLGPIPPESLPLGKEEGLPSPIMPSGFRLVAG